MFYHLKGEMSKTVITQTVLEKIKILYFHGQMLKLFNRYKPTVKSTSLFSFLNVGILKFQLGFTDTASTPTPFRFFK